MAVVYPYDINGSLDSNEIKNEIQTFPSKGSRGFSMLAPKLAPFHKRNFSIALTDGTPLIENTDFEFGWYYEGLSNKQDAPEIFMAIVLKNLNLIGAQVKMTYHTVGAEFTMVNADWQEFARSQLVNPTDAIWDTLIDRPGLYSTDPNLVLMEDAVGWDRFISKVGQLVDESTLTYNRIKTMIDMHVNNEVNAHDIDLTLLGLDRFKNMKKATLATLEAGVNPTQYLGVIETRAFLKNNYVPIGGTTSISLNGPTVAYQGTELSWVITDFDSFASYVVESSFMQVSLVENVIRATVHDDANVGTRTFTVSKNNIKREIKLEILGVGIGQPSLIGIMEGESNVSTIASVNSSNFTALPSGSDSFSNVQYEVSRTASFSDIVFSKTAVALNTMTLDLPAKTQLYIRVRHIGQSGRVSAWSTVISFITGEEVERLDPIPNTSVSWRDRVTVFTNQSTNERENVQVSPGISISSLSAMNDETLVLELKGAGQTVRFTNGEYMSYVRNNSQSAYFSQWKLDHVQGPRSLYIEARFYRETDGVKEYSDAIDSTTITTDVYMN